jgi:hypothetical protein
MTIAHPTNEYRHPKLSMQIMAWYPAGQLLSPHQIMLIGNKTKATTTMLDVAT